MRRYAIFVLAALISPACGWSQTTGLPPFGSLDRVGLEVRNNQDLNVLLAIPIMSSPGRNGLDLDFSLVYNSSIWAKSGSAWVPNSTVVPPWGWATAYSVGASNYKSSTRQTICDRNLGDVMYIDYYTQNGYTYTDPLGTVHSFNVNWQETYNECTGSDTTSGTFTGYATDGSGYYMVLDQSDGSISALIAKNGFHIGPGITDLNGNYISSTINGNETDWTDSAGRVALKVVTGSSSIQYKFLDPNGNYQVTTLNLQSFNIKTNFGCSGVVEYTGTANLPVSLVLPNSQTYTFSYEQTPSNPGYYTGRLQQFTLPTGGWYTYSYLGSNDGASCTDGTTLTLNRTVNDESGDATWNYVRNTTDLTTTITTPTLADTNNAFDTIVTFNTSGQEAQRRIFANSPGSGIPVLRIDTRWAANGTPASRKTTLEDGTTQSEVDTTYDSNGLLDSETEYDYGSGGHGGAIRTTTFTYVTDTNYTSRNIIDLVNSKTIKDGSGTVQYAQALGYDSTYGDNQSCPSGAPQHNDGAYGCAFFYRGNPTYMTTYLSPATLSNPITKYFTYDVFGNLLTAQVDCCQTKTWTYSATTEYSEPDSVKTGSSPVLTASTTYNQYTGQILTFADENGLITNYSYDTMRRPTQIWQTNGQNVSYSYQDTSFTATTTIAIDGSKSMQQSTTLNGLGLPHVTTISDVHGNGYSSASTTYDLAGRVYKSAGPLSNSTVAAFDVLGRPTSVALADGSTM